MRNVARVLAGIAAAGAVVLACRLDAAQPAPKAPKKTATACSIPQSPRMLTSDHWNRTEPVPEVTRLTEDSVTYSPRPGVSQVLHKCSQHYHCRIENVQRCVGQTGSGGGLCPPLRAGNWVEIHTAYQNFPSAINPLPENLESCVHEPVVVVGYHAKLTSASALPPIPEPFGPTAAEWSGSSTNVDPPSCKGPAFWHFALGCDFTVSTQQITNRFHHQDRARPLQSQDRLSHDLTYIPGSKTP